MSRMVVSGRVVWDAKSYSAGYAAEKKIMSLSASQKYCSVSGQMLTDLPISTGV